MEIAAATSSAKQMFDPFRKSSTPHTTVRKDSSTEISKRKTTSTDAFSPPGTFHCRGQLYHDQGYGVKGRFLTRGMLSCPRNLTGDRLPGIVSNGRSGSRVLNLNTHRFNVHFCSCSSRTVFEIERGAERASSSGDDGDVDDSALESSDDGNILQESLNLFEWPAICAQVAQFASTPMATSICMDGDLTIGTTRAQSDELLDQTAAALALLKPLDFSGIENLQGIVGDVLLGNVCQISDFVVIRSSLLGIQNVHNQLFDSSSESSNGKLTSLQSLLGGCDLCSDLVRDIDHSIDCTLETVLDRASPALAAARLGRKENMKALESALKETASWVVQQGGMDSVVVTRRRARSCIAVRSSHKNLLPGGITLDVSNTGATSFMEPEAALELNNEEMRLAGVEKAEELAVLRTLTLKMVDKAEVIMDLMGRITVIDLACAKASHAKWLDCVRPFFHDSFQDEATQAELPDDVLLVDIEAIRHPLLLGSALPKLAASDKVGVIKSAFSTSRTSTSSEADKTAQAGVRRPVPVDITVESYVRVVTITGPNTGGKTATLKTFGVAALMAKAGMFLPAAGQPKLPWFDNVLADVGDEQSLERSLSTFSGHIRRLRSILATSTSRSLVLLDEVGGGTDPTEGAALAIAVLRHLSDQVRLCVATTHSAQLKVLKDQDSRFENASVEFDIRTLRPTYKVLWGIAGQSNALDIAESLGFDRQVLGRARELLFKMKPSQLEVRTVELLVPLVKQTDEQVERATRASQVLANAKQLHQELSAAAVNLPKRETASKRKLSEAVEDDIAKCSLELEQIIEKFQETVETDSSPSIREVQAEIASIVEKYTIDKGLSTRLDFLPPALRTPKSSLSRPPVADSLVVGELVIVRRLGKTPVTVVEIPQGGEYVTVQLGSLNLQVKTSEVIKMRSAGSVPTPKSSQQVPDRAKAVVTRQIKGQASAAGAADTEKFEAAVQTSKNTLDLRGMRVEDAVRVLNLTLSSKSPESVLFVVHGVGTGVVKEATLQVLRKHPYVSKFEEESITNAGCTVVYIK